MNCSDKLSDKVIQNLTEEQIIMPYRKYSCGILSQVKSVGKVVDMLVSRPDTCQTIQSKKEN